MAAHGVDGNNANIKVKQTKQLGNGLDFIRFRLGFDLAEHHLVFAGSSADHMDRPLAKATIIGAAQGFSINRNQLAGSGLLNGFHPN